MVHKTLSICITKEGRRNMYVPNTYESSDTREQRLRFSRFAWDVAPIRGVYNRIQMYSCMFSEKLTVSCLNGSSALTQELVIIICGISY